MNYPTTVEVEWGNNSMSLVQFVMRHVMKEKPKTREQLSGFAFGLIESAVVTFMQVHGAEEPEHDPDFTLRLTCLAREAIENELREMAKQRN